MLSSIFRKFFAGLTAFFWADKKRLFLGLLASFWSVQHIACAYGTDEPCEGACSDPAMQCTPVFDVSMMSGNGYSDCEKTVKENIDQYEYCNTVCASEKAQNVQTTRIDNLNLDLAYCDRQDAGTAPACDENRIGQVAEWLRHAANSCDMKHLKAEGSLTGYKCKNGETVSVEEGERRIEAYKKDAGVDSVRY